MKKFLLYILLFTIIPLGGMRGASYTLVIDAGHGGKDAGAIGAFSQEKNINLAVALAFGKYVEKNCPDVRVVYTRKTDVFIELDERANIANRNKADLFISVHTNSLPKGKIAYGFETYTLGMHRAADNLAVAKRENSVITMESDYKTKYEDFDPNSAESYIMFEYMQDKNMENSVKLARQIQKCVCASASRQDKGVYQAGFLVLRKTSMPSCLIELGFISTPEEEQQLNDPIVQNQLAKGIYEAFMRYRGQTPVYNWSAPVPEKPRQPETVAEQPETTVKQSAATVEQPAAPAKQPAGNQVVYKVQLASLKTKARNNDSRFRDLPDIDFYEEGGLFKYTCGAFSTQKEASQLRHLLLDRFPEAFVIKTRNGQRIK